MFRDWLKLQTILSLLCLTACETKATPDDELVSETGEGAFTDFCTKNADCESGLCTSTRAGIAICTQTCDSRAECPSGTNWRCGAPLETDATVCLCNDGATGELCGDGLDNDCDGKVDNCLECAGQLFEPSSRQNCGTCGNACPLGTICSEGACKCPDGASAEGCTGVNAPQCTRDVDCDDGILCTDDLCVEGSCVSRVAPARCAAGFVCDLRKGGCEAGTPCAVDADCADTDPCTTDEACDPAVRTCTWLPLDGDADGVPPRVCGGTDCDDSRATVFPGAPEVCDLVDNNCNGEIDSPLANSVDLNTDDANCGACGNFCLGGFACSAGECKDIDECEESSRCDELTVCTNKVGGFSCSGCPAGYSGSGLTGCNDVNECLQGNACGNGGYCENTPGSYQCACNEGYMPSASGMSCVDVNECLTANICGEHSTGCTNYTGYFGCDCEVGYEPRGPSGECVELNECEFTNPCYPANCENTEGSYLCACSPGSTLHEQGSCEYANECQNSPCGEHGACTDYYDTFYCTGCPTYGSKPSGPCPPEGCPTCIDVDECALGVDTCDANHDCVNSVVDGVGYTCELKPGLRP